LGILSNARSRLTSVAGAVSPREGFVRNILVLAGGTILGQGIVVLASPIITRLYNPADLGTLAVYSSILGIISVISGMRYETAIPLPEKDEDAVNIISLTLCIIVLFSIVVALACLVFGNEIVHLVNVPALEPVLWLVPIGVGMIGVYQVFGNWATRKQAFHLVARTKINQGIGSVLVQVGLGFLGIKAFGLIAGQIVGQASGASTLIRLYGRQERPTLRAVSIKRMCYCARRYRRFPSIAAPAAALNSVTVYIPAIMLTVLFGPQVAGWFSITQRAIGMPLNLIGQSVAQVYVGKAAPLARSSPVKFKRLFLRLFLRLSGFGLLLIVPIVFFAPRLFTIVFGASWKESGAYVPLLAGLFITQFVSSPLGGTLDILERQELFLSREAIRVAFIIIAFVVIKMFNFPPRSAVATIGTAGALGYAVYALFAWHAIKQHAKRSI